MNYVVFFYFGSNHSRSESTQWDSRLPAIGLRQRGERSGRRALEQGIRLLDVWLCHASRLAGLEEGLTASSCTAACAVACSPLGTARSGQHEKGWGRQRKQDPNSYHPDGVLASPPCLAIVLMLLWSSVRVSQRFHMLLNSVSANILRHCWFKWKLG